MKQAEIILNFKNGRYGFHGQRCGSIEYLLAEIQEFSERYGLERVEATVTTDREYTEETT